MLADDADLAQVCRRGPIETVAAQQRDVLVHDVRAFHASGVNRSQQIRRSIIIEFAPADLEIPTKEP